MHIAFLTIPSSGEINVQLATARELLDLGHSVTFMTGNSFSKKMDRWRAELKDPSARERVGYIPLGDARAVEDFTPTVQERIHLMRKEPGDVSSLEACIDIGLTPPEEFRATAYLVRDHIFSLDPDMIVVDCLSPPMISGVRMTKRSWMFTVPCSPGFTALSSAFDPHPVAGDRSGSWKTFYENMYISTRLLLNNIRRNDLSLKRSILSKEMRLTSFGINGDLTLLPPMWEDPHCVGGIHFNAPGLTDCPKQPASIVFVGAGFHLEENIADGCDETRWMDEAQAAGEDVVYVNMGSMFIWLEHEFWNCIQALKDVHKLRGGKIRFLFKMNRPLDSEKTFAIDAIPSYIRLTNWIASQQSVYSHPALKAFVHHGGGNSFNEAVFFGVPQLVLSQWLDTHEYGVLAEKFGFGIRSSRPPYIETADIRDKLLYILGPQWSALKSSAVTWSLRTRLAGGPAAAARIVESHARIYGPYSGNVPIKAIERSIN